MTNPTTQDGGEALLQEMLGVKPSGNLRDIMRQTGRKIRDCRYCKGQGTTDGGEFHCDACDGEGTVIEEAQS